MVSTRLNAIDQALDIAGSLIKSQTLTLTDERDGLGAALAGQTGSGASVSALVSGGATISGLSNMSADSAGNFLTLTNVDAGNLGTFLIVKFNSPSSVDISNATATSPDSHDTHIVWTERSAYSAQDDFNYERTDRAAIKGTDYYAAVPTYVRPDATLTTRPANLTNIAGKTTDARGFIFNRQYLAASVVASDSFITLSSTNNFQHATTTNHVGVPCFDTGQYAGDWTGCFVDIMDPVSDTQLTAVGGDADGYRIFGITRTGSSLSPDAIEIEFRAVHHGDDLSNSIPYTWDTDQPTTIDLVYGYFERLDTVNDNALRQVKMLGLLSDADLRSDVDHLQTTIGNADGTSSLAGNLTSLTAYFPFNTLDGTPSVVEALNVLNGSIGNRTYSGTVLGSSSGQSISQTIQTLASAIDTTTITRTIVRLTNPVAANTPITTPTYTSGNIWVYSRGILRHAGSVASGNDYTETSTTSITFYSKLNSGDILDFFIKG